MNIGDLVTLSSRGRNLEACRGLWRREKPLVGMIISVKDSRFDWDKEIKYHIRWAGGDGPAGRQRWHCDYWHRCDLKFVSKAKRKK